MLSWPEKAREALALLFRPLQDIDVYVEDLNDETFYTELLRRVAPAHVRIARVFALGNKQKVLDAASQHDFRARRALFMVDGDFEWVRGEPAPAQKGTYRLEAYCIENLLLDENALVRLIVEEEAIPEETARTQLGFGSWVAKMEAGLIDLFVVFAASNKLNKAAPTVSLGCGGIISVTKRRTDLDPTKIATLQATVEAAAVAASSPKGYADEAKSIRSRIAALPSPIDSVSGKDFVLPLLEFHIRDVTTWKPRRKSLRMRLACACSRERFSGLIEAIGRS